MITAWHSAGAFSADARLRGAPWHAALVDSRRYAKTDAALGALEGVDEIFAPLRIVKTVVRGQVLSRPVPYFGRAVFARFEGGDAHLWHRIKRTNGVHHILGEDQPKTVPDADIDRARSWIRELEAGLHGSEEEVAPPCKPGDQILFSYLSFHDLRAPVRRVEGGVITVEVPLLGVPTLVHLPFSAVLEVVEKSAEPGVKKRKSRRRRRRRHHEVRQAAAAD
jgi:transcription antitermination factor NusG